MSKSRKGPKGFLYGGDIMHPLKDGVKSFPTPLPISGIREGSEDPDEEENHDEDENGEEGSIFEIKRTPSAISKHMRRRVIEVGGRDIVVFETPKRGGY